MRRPLTTLTLALTCGLVLLGAAVAIAIEARSGAGSGAPKAAADGAVASDAGVLAARRSWPLRMSAAPDDLALAEVSFPHAARGQRISTASLRVLVAAPFGDDYLAAGAPRLSSAGSRRALVLLVNRPSALLDPVFVHVQLIANGAMGVPVVRQLADPLTRPPGARARALCDLPLRGAALGASQMQPLASRGKALAGFDTAGALAQAYDIACGLAHSSAFERAVEQPPETPTTSAPSPAPPVGRVPGEGCEPRPGYACPGVAAGASAATAAGG